MIPEQAKEDNELIRQFEDQGESAPLCDYHESYECLMRVVEKISQQSIVISIYIGKTKTIVAMSSTENYQLIKKDFTREQYTPIEVIRKAVVEYIKLFNLQDHGKKEISSSIAETGTKSSTTETTEEATLIDD